MICDLLKKEGSTVTLHGRKALETFARAVSKRKIHILMAVASGYRGMWRSINISAYQQQRRCAPPGIVHDLGSGSGCHSAKTNRTGKRNRMGHHTSFKHLLQGRYSLYNFG